MVIKALAIDAALANAGGREGLVIRAFNEVDDDGFEGWEMVLLAELVDTVDVGESFRGSNDGVVLVGGRGGAERVVKRKNGPVFRLRGEEIREVVVAMFE
jgi:hypothetical protein